MTVHITLVNPPYPLGSHLHPPFLPLGLGYLAAVLEKNNYKVDIIDCQALKIGYDEAKEEIKTRQPDIVGITSTTLTYKSALKIVQMAKEVNPNILTIMGGPTRHLLGYPSTRRMPTTRCRRKKRRRTNRTRISAKSRSKTKFQRHIRHHIPRQRANSQNRRPPLARKPRRITLPSHSSVAY